MKTSQEKKVFCNADADADVNADADAEIPEFAVVHSCAIKKVFFKVLQISTCAGVSFLVK